MIDLEDIGRQIAVARREKKLTQMRLAKSAGVSRATVDLLENGRASDVGFSKVTRMMAAVGLELNVQSKGTTGRLLRIS